MEQYLGRALELRTIARGLKDPEARVALLEIAQEYIMLARAIRNYREDDEQRELRADREPS